MRRREFLSLVSGAAAAWPFAVHAQQPEVPVIGYFSSRSYDAEAPLRTPFLKALEESGFAPGRNVAVEYLFSDGRDERLPSLAAELVRRRVAMLVATDLNAARAAKVATAATAIPVVFGSGFDPVQLGLVASLSRPGGNVTGVSVFTSELGPKRLGLLREMLPTPGTIAFVVNPSNATTPSQIQEMQAAARSVGQDLFIVEIGAADGIERAFAAITARNAAAIIYGASASLQVISAQLVAAAARHRIPALYEWREFVADGGLMSYSSNRAEVGRQAGIYAARILKGEKPADLPVVQALQFELVINLKTAKSLGLVVPPTLLARADEVIE